ncbi:MAG: type II toxin-antitoxin system HicA family toxin [Patescibacteria group bacterium]
MGRLAGFGYQEVTRRLKRLGFEFDRHARGSHEIWWNSATRRRTTIPNHPGDLPEGTVRAILLQAGVTPEEFLEVSH